MPDELLEAGWIGGAAAGRLIGVYPSMLLTQQLRRGGVEGVLIRRLQNTRALGQGNRWLYRREEIEEVARLRRTCGLSLNQTLRVYRAMKEGILEWVEE